MGRFVFLSGPPCVGKGPLVNNLAKRYPEVAASLNRVVLYNSRPLRLGEVDGRDYHFVTRDRISVLAQSSRYMCFPVHNDWQALDLVKVKDAATQDDRIGFLEIHYAGAAKILKEKWQEWLRGVAITTIFMAPLCRFELQPILAEGGMEEAKKIVDALMAKKLLRRTLVRNFSDNQLLNDGQKERIARLSGVALTEMRAAEDYDYVIPCHDGEESPHWDLPVLFGDAALALSSFADILAGRGPGYVEHWEGLFKAGMK